MTAQPLTSPVDYVLLAGKKSPGIAEIRGAGSPRKWEERRGYGTSGATLVFRGRGLAKFTLTLRLYTPEDWDDWHAWRPLVQAEPVDAGRSESRVLGRQAVDAAVRARAFNQNATASNALGDPVGAQAATVSAQREERRSLELAARARAAGERQATPRALDIWHPFLEDLGIRSVVVEDVGQPERTHDSGEWTLEIKLIEFRAPRPAIARPQGSQERAASPVLDERDQLIQRLSRDLAQELAAG